MSIYLFTFRANIPGADPLFSTNVQSGPISSVSTTALNRFVMEAERCAAQHSTDVESLSVTVQLQPEENHESSS